MGGAAPAVAAKPQVTVSKPAAALPGPRYTWVEMPKVQAAESDTRVSDAQFRSRLQAALDKALQAKGYRPVEAGAKADFIVGYRVGVRDVAETTVHDMGGTSTPLSAVECGGGGCSQLATLGNDGVPVMKVDTKTHTEGGLMVEVIEPGTIRVLWRATSRGTVKSGKATQGRLDAVAADTLAQLPAAAH
jgi:hypothetical protein